MIKTNNKEFMKLVSPILGWIANNKNPFYDSVKFSLRNDENSESPLGLELTFFLNEKPSHWEYSNTFISLYQFQSLEALTAIKAHIKLILKAESVREFELIDRQIEAL